MDFSSDQSNSTATPGVPPGKRPQIRWLTILILVMVGVTVITGLIAIHDWLSYLLIVVGDVDLSLAMVREQEEGRSLFWPALLVTAILWLWKSLAETSRMRLPALVLTGLALYGVVTWTIMDGADTREPFVVRTWMCPAGTAAWDLTARDPACAEFPADDVSWFMIEENLNRPISAADFQKPSSRQGNVSIWEGLPQGRYVVYLTNDASVERYESIALISLRDDEATGFPGFMHVSELTDGTWVSRVEIETWLQGIDVYLIPAATRAPSGGPTSPEINARHSLPQTDPKLIGHRYPRGEPGIPIDALQLQRRSIFKEHFQVISELRNIRLDRVPDQRVADVMIPMDDPVPERYRPANVRQDIFERSIGSQSDSQRLANDLQEPLRRTARGFIAAKRGEVQLPGQSHKLQADLLGIMQPQPLGDFDVQRPAPGSR